MWVRSGVIPDTCKETPLWSRHRAAHSGHASLLCVHVCYYYRCLHRPLSWCNSTLWYQQHQCHYCTDWESQSIHSIIQYNMLILLTETVKLCMFLYANAEDAYNATALPWQMTPQSMRSDNPKVCHTCSASACPHIDCGGGWILETLQALQGLPWISGCPLRVILQTWNVHCYPNNKPLITSNLKAHLNKRKRASGSVNREELTDRGEYSLNLERCWRCAKTPTGGSWRPNSSRRMWGVYRLEWGPLLGTRWEAHGYRAVRRGQMSWTGWVCSTDTFPSPCMQIPSHPHCHKWHTPPTVRFPLKLTPLLFEETSTFPRMTVPTGEVRRQLGRLHQWKAAVPSGFSPEIIRTTSCLDVLLSQESILDVLPGSDVRCNGAPLCWPVCVREGGPLSMDG